MAEAMIILVFWWVSCYTSYALGRRRRRPPRHTHQWVVIEKEQAEGMGADQAVRIAARSAYSTSALEIAEIANTGTSVVVHRRCDLCGEEEILRL